MTRFFRLALALLALPVSAASAQTRRAAPVSPFVGNWDAALTIPAGEVPFGLEVIAKKGVLGGAIRNGPEPMRFSGAVVAGDSLTLRLDQYDSRLVVRRDPTDPTQLTGRYLRPTTVGTAAYPFHAARRPARAMNRRALGRWTGPVVTGEWMITLGSGSDGETDLLTLTQAGGTGADGRVGLTGTILPVSGDYGLLSGAMERTADGASRFTMSRFDGIHVARLTGEVAADGSLSGTFVSGKGTPVGWTATRKSVAAVLADGSKLTTVKDPTEPFRFSGVDTTGRVVASTDPRFKGKVVLVDIFGTWCPNCHDEAPLLVELAKQYGAQGLEVIGLAYEYTADPVRNARQMGVFARKYGISYPMLVAGTLNQGEIARTLPQLVGFGAYPTTVFIGRDGRVAQIHAGFAGPATGARHGEMVREFHTLVETLLKQNAN